MPRVDFYVLGEQAVGDRYLLACRVIAAALTKQEKGASRIYVHTSNRQQCEHMDRLLWTFRDDSFIPHGLAGESNPALNPVLIGWQGDGAGEHQLLVNLAEQVPEFYSRFNRVAEFVDADPQVKEAGRGRWRYYQSQGIDPGNIRIEK